MADLEKTVSIIFAGVDNLSGTASQINRSFSDLGGSISSVADPLAGIAESVLKAEAALAALAVGGLVVAFNASMQFESAMIELKKVVGDQPEALNAAKTAAIELSDKYGQSATDILASMADFKQAGFDMGEAMSLAAVSMDTVIAGGMEASAASQMLVSSLKGFREPASEASRLLEILNTVSANYNTNVEQLGIGMASLSPIAYQMGFSMEETAGILTPVIEIFGSGEEAATAFKTGLNRLISNQKPVTDTLKALGVAQYDLNGNLRSGKDILYDVQAAFQGLDNSQKLVYTQQLVGINQSAKMVEAFDNLAKTTNVTAIAMEHGSTAADEVKARLESAEVSVDRFKVAFENLSVAVGDSFRVAAQEAIDGGTEIENTLRNMVNSGAFDPLLNMVAEFAEDTGAYLSGIAQALPEAMEGVDFSALIEQVRGLGTEIGEAFDLLFGSFDLTKPEELEAAIQKVVDVIKNLTAMTSGVLEGMSPLFSAIGIGIEKFAAMDTETAKLLGNVSGAGKTISEFVNALQKIGPALDVLTYGTIITATTNVLALLLGLGGLGVIAIPAGIAVGLAALGYEAFKVWEGIKGLKDGMDALPEVVNTRVVISGGDEMDIITGYIYDLDGKTVDVPVNVTLSDGGTINTVTGFITDADGKEVMVNSAVTLQNGDTLDMINGFLKEAETGKVYDLKTKLTVDEPSGQNEKLIEALRTSEANIEVSYELNPDTGKFEAVIKEIGASTEAALNANVKGPVMETLEWIDEEGQRHELKVPVDNTDINKTKAAVEAIPTEKMLEIELQGEVDKELERIKAAAGIVQTKMEWQAKVDIAKAEASIRAFEASISSVNAGIESTGNTLVGLFDALSGPGSLKASSLIDKEADYREQQFELQKKFLEQQIELNKEKLDAIKSGESMISISAEGLEPELEAFMWKIIEQVQVRATEEASEFLLGI